MDVSSNSVTTVSGQEHKQNTSLTTLTTTKRLLTNNGVRQLQDFNLQTHLDDRIRGDQQQTQGSVKHPVLERLLNCLLSGNIRANSVAAVL